MVLLNEFGEAQLAIYIYIYIFCVCAASTKVNFDEIFFKLDRRWCGNLGLQWRYLILRFGYGGNPLLAWLVFLATM